MFQIIWAQQLITTPYKTSCCFHRLLKPFQKRVRRVKYRKLIIWILGIAWVSWHKRFENICSMAVTSPKAACDCHRMGHLKGRGYMYFGGCTHWYPDCCYGNNETLSSKYVKTCSEISKVCAHESLPSKEIYRVSQEERTKLREGVLYVKLYRYNPKRLYPKLNGYGDNGQRKVWTSCISAFYTPTVYRVPPRPVGHVTSCRKNVG